MSLVTASSTRSLYDEESVPRSIAAFDDPGRFSPSIRVSTRFWDDLTSRGAIVLVVVLCVLRCGLFVVLMS